jgi:hypothetical protein
MARARGALTCIEKANAPGTDGASDLAPSYPAEVGRRNNLLGSYSYAGRDERTW